MTTEEKCICGSNIPRGYGYYNYNRSIRCKYCGRINKRKHIETPKELLQKLEKTEGKKKE